MKILLWAIAPVLPAMLAGCFTLPMEEAPRPAPVAVLTVEHSPPRTYYVPAADVMPLTQHDLTRETATDTRHFCSCVDYSTNFAYCKGEIPDVRSCATTQGVGYFLPSAHQPSYEARPKFYRPPPPTHYHPSVERPYRKAAPAKLHKVHPVPKRQHDLDRKKSGQK